MTLPIRKITLPLKEEKENKLKHVDVESILQKAQQEAEEIVQSALAEKESVYEEIRLAKQHWEKERELFIEEAKKKGYEDGYRSGEKEGFTQYESLIKQAEQIIEVANQEFTKKIESSDEEILKIAFKVAEKILHQVIDEDQEAFRHLVRQVIEEVKENTEVKISVHPNQYELIVFHKEEFEQLFTKKVELYIVPDAKLKPYSVEVESPSGKIDAGVETQIEQLQIKLLEYLREG